MISDIRLENCDIFNFRKSQWNKELVIELVEKLFQTITMIDNWEYIGNTCEKNYKKRYEELKRNITFSNTFKLKDCKGNEHSYTLKFPKLIKDQFFYIGGFYKIPIMQLYDNPVIYKPKSPNIIKIQNNVLSGLLTKDKDFEYTLNIFKKKLNFIHLLCAFYDENELDDYYNFINRPNSELTTIIDMCKEQIKEHTKEYFYKEIGKHFTTIRNSEEAKGRSVCFSIKLAYELDFFHHRYFNTNSFLLEFLQAIQDGCRSDTDIFNKRIRLNEYILIPLIKEIYNLILNAYNFKDGRKTFNYKIAKSIILDKCNVSDIVHYNMSINPVSEIASLLQVTVTGPGGFKKEQVPRHLRTLDESHFGYIDPADTPDRDGCGVILNLSPSVKLNKYGEFIKNNNPDIINSYSILMTPFLANDDQTRLQMASSQVKQSILLKQSEAPYIRTGVEACFNEHTSFLFKAEDDGEVVYLSDELMIISYNNVKKECIKPYYKDFMVDYLEPKFEMYSKFKRGDILCESKFLKNGETTLGNNLLVGIMPWHGWNYEDGIVISQKVADEYFTSIHNVEYTIELDPNQVLMSLNNDYYEPFPYVGSKLKKGETYAKIKTIDFDTDLENLNIEAKEFKTNVDCEIVSIEIYPNKWNKNISEYNNFLSSYASKQTKYYTDLQSKLIQNTSKEECEEFIHMNGLNKLNTNGMVGKYTHKSKKIKGVLIKIKCIYEEKINIGDKISNRHAAKGVVSCIVPDDQMPYINDGTNRKLDIIVNPLGIISRMNAGQLYELHLSECLYQLKQKLLTKSYEDGLKLLEQFYNIIDKTPTKYISKYFINLYKDIIDKELPIDYIIDKLYIIQPAFESITPIDLFKCMILTSKGVIPDNVSDEYFYDSVIDKYEVIDPTMDNAKVNISCGYMYFTKLVHRASDKISYRSVGPYSQKTLQPLGGKSNMGGHRLGEMEVWSLLAYDANHLLKSLLTTHSDSSGLKNKMIRDILENENIQENEEDDNQPTALKLLEHYLKILGLEIHSEL
jgi:DNA-directed RNA polymerase beta subunit